MQMLKRFAHRQGFLIQRLVPPDRLHAFFAAVRPMQTNWPLIRVGGEADGGYLIPDDLDGVVACFSPGVDVTATFEADLIARGIRCFQADASVERSPLDGEPLVDFEPKFLGTGNDACTVTLDRWVADKMPGEGDLLLQMDIEGAEWLVLANASDETLARFRIMAIEFHHFERIHDPFALEMIGAVFAKLARHFAVVHVHPNNVAAPVGSGDYAVPPFIEYTFLRHDRVSGATPATRFPHPLDRDNVAAAPVVLPSAMYASPGRATGGNMEGIGQ